ncbi:MAG: hypothetical protein ACTSYR_06255 [Candidatus Odinarchaeia archaeon]
MKENYKYNLWCKLEKLGWVVAPIPASGAGRKGYHRPDLIFGNGRKVYVAEVKNSKLPLYLNIEKDIKPVIHFANALTAKPIIILKKKYSKKWLVFKIADLEKCSDRSYVVNSKNLKKAIPLEDFLNEN